jgi:hypothetical protein
VIGRFRIPGFGFRVSGFGFRVSGSGFRVPGFGFQIPDFGCRVSGSGLRGLGVQGYLAHKKTPTPLGTPWDPRQRPTVGS